MGNHKSAVKRNRQNIKRRDRNRQARAALRTSLKKALVAIESGEVVVAKEATQKATKLIDKAVIHGLIHKNNGRNKVSGLMTRLYQLEKQS